MTHRGCFLPPYAGDPMEDRRVVHAISRLPWRLAEVLFMWYGLDGEEPKSFREIGERLGVSAGRASKIRDQALLELARLDSPLLNEMDRSGESR